MQIRDLVDILLVALILYRLLILLRGTRALQVLFGLGAVTALYILSQWFDLATLNWLLNHFFTYLVLILVILFQEEIRTVLATLGRRSFFGRPVSSEQEELITAVVLAVATLRERKIGALLVLERNDRLGQYLKTGTQLDALPSRELLVGLFLSGNPLHDGAVILREGRVVAAGCFLPLAMEDDLPRKLGTRHRAAIGLARESDALVVVVSEERCEISLVDGNRMIEKLDRDELRKLLRELFGVNRFSDEEEPVSVETTTVKGEQ